MGTAVLPGTARITNQVYVPANGTVTVSFEWNVGDDPSSVLHGGFNNILNMCIDVDITPDFNSAFLTTHCFGPVQPTSVFGWDVVGMSVSAVLYWRITTLWDYGFILGQVWETTGPMQFTTINAPLNCTPTLINGGTVNANAQAVIKTISYDIPSDGVGTLRTEAHIVASGGAESVLQLLGVSPGNYSVDLNFGLTLVGQTFSIFVRRYCDANTFSDSRMISFTVPDFVGPSGLSASVDGDGGGVTLDWTPPSLGGPWFDEWIDLTTDPTFTVVDDSIHSTSNLAHLDVRPLPSGTWNARITSFNPVNQQWTESNHVQFVIPGGGVQFFPASGLVFTPGAVVGNKSTVAFNWSPATEGQMFLDISKDSVFPDFVGKNTNGQSINAGGITESGGSDSVVLDANTQYFARVSTLFNGQFYVSPVGFPIGVFVPGNTGGPIPKLPGDNFIVDMVVSDDIPVDVIPAMSVYQIVNGAAQVIVTTSARISLANGTNAIRLVAQVPSGLPVGTLCYPAVAVELNGQFAATWATQTDPEWVISG